MPLQIRQVLVPARGGALAHKTGKYRTMTLAAQRNAGPGGACQEPGPRWTGYARHGACRC
eukprot:1515378-Lingulodinium_polyedra.AAC.1